MRPTGASCRAVAHRPSRSSRLAAVETIGRGVAGGAGAAPGFGVTLVARHGRRAGRVVVPILLQQAIDKGFITDEGCRSTWSRRSPPSARSSLVIAGFAQRQAVVRLGTRSEEALYGLRVRLFDHIHRLSLADHNEERRGALVARVTSDIETLAQFFQWGGLAWLLDGTLMLLVAAVMLAYDWILALVAFAVAAPLAFVLRVVQRHLVAAYERARERNADMLTSISEVVSGAETIRVYDAGARYGSRREEAITTRSDA